MIAIVDYGIGNLRSIEKAFAAVGVTVQISGNKEVLETAEALVLPGVGAFGDAINTLRATNFDQLIISAAKAGKPILGVCLGYQLLFEESEEFGLHRGLALLPGRVVKFPESELRIPHVGWNQVRQCKQHPLLFDFVDNDFFYFVHSFYVKPSLDSDVIGVTDYGIEFSAIAGRDNVVGVQFHPEKSQQAGLKLLKNFSVRMVEKC